MSADESVIAMKTPLMPCVTCGLSKVWYCQLGLVADAREAADDRRFRRPRCSAGSFTTKRGGERACCPRRIAGRVGRPRDRDLPAKLTLRKPCFGRLQHPDDQEAIGAGVDALAGRIAAAGEAPQVGVVLQPGDVGGAASTASRRRCAVRKVHRQRIDGIAALGRNPIPAFVCVPSAPVVDTGDRDGVDDPRTSLRGWTAGR